MQALIIAIIGVATAQASALPVSSPNYHRYISHFNKYSIYSSSDLLGPTQN